MLAALALALCASHALGDAQAPPLGERRCEHDAIGIVTASERAAELAFEDRHESRLQGEVLDQARRRAPPRLSAWHAAVRTPRRIAVGQARGWHGSHMCRAVPAVRSDARPAAAHHRVGLQPRPR